MVRVKRGVIAHKRREKLLKYAKGFRWGRKSKERFAREALLHAWSNAFRGRKLKKRENRRIWQSKIAAASQTKEISYSKLMGALKKKNIELNRKVLAELAENHPHIFERILEHAKEKTA